MLLSETLSMSVSFAFLIKSPSSVLPTTREEKKEFKEFLANEGGGEAPLEGSVPDITSSTEHYVALQKTYQAKAEADFLVLTKGLGLF
ncbi:putative THIF-type NAD/FAD binding protein [Rosa chinensis]|uniref:Putative THIF-type NAD/FAD binding protein n=1 Tax=Rosa chinensis TaxID=74649 RepID=A0A2P6S9M7_ROSCH|nr:putative THIF-type NAD/FAD binding protein [Rosa chinensis]